MDPRKKTVKSKSDTTSIDIMEPGSAGPAEKWMLDSLDGDHAMASSGSKRASFPADELGGARPGEALNDRLGGLLTNDPNGDMNMREHEGDDPDYTMPMDDGDGPDKESPAEDKMDGFFVDRIDGDKAIILMGEKSMVLPLSALPPGAKEGQYFDGAGNPVSDDRDGEANELRSVLAAGDPGGDISLEGPGPDDPMPPSPVKIRGKSPMTKVRMQP